MRKNSEPISFLSLLETTWPEEIFIGGGLMSRGDTMMIAADSKAGKSTFIQGMNRQIMTGGKFLGFSIPKPLRILYMQAELRENRLKTRLKPAFDLMFSSEEGQKYKDLISKSYCWNTKGLITFDGDMDLIKEKIDLLKPDIIEIDPMLNFHNLDENKATDMAKLFRSLDRLKSEYDLSIIMAQHFRKSSKEHGASLLEMLRGSSSIRGWADTTIAIEGRSNNELRRLEFDIRNSDILLERLIKYNQTTKEFDWFDPICEAEKILSGILEKAGKMNTTQFVKLVMKHCGHLVSSNKNQAQLLKEKLLELNFILATPEGKQTFISLA